MQHKSFSMRRIILYILLCTGILIFSAVFSTYLQHAIHIPTKIQQLLSGLIFTIGTVITLILIKRKRPNIISDLNLQVPIINKSFIFAICLPLILMLLVFVVTGLAGMYDQIHINLNSRVWLSFLFNIVFAILYEAFPEEVFIRGLILNELKNKMSFKNTLIIQPICFLIIACLAQLLTPIFFGEKGLLDISYITIIFTFGIALQLYREYAQSLWANMFFHIVYLEAMRNIFPGNSESLIIFQEQLPGLVALVGIMTLYLGSIVILGVLLWRRNNTSINTMSRH
ncbi:CPBP family intramembrane glutamic endopeptidase [Mammaliicoccus sciuri]|uniref:CPBP family intramembrane glutamic endopeptidase n=2 Tax=Mammaliicoccus sciuri TaxID=1296 RepID=UPI001957856B|nr:CPBP family intramembrane glutamic endopeptidase [Mammaliicoccus sciuri]MCD8837102.1 CPBP family intramembrane metalloprotease [Mammaliicoccus sciuri]